MLDIFRRKTSPAFEVALRSAPRSPARARTCATCFASYSEALGIAYQIRDDLEDLTGTDAPDDIAALRPSLPLALGVERAKGQDEDGARGAPGRLAARHQRRRPRRCARGSIELSVEDRCRALLEAYKEQAIRTLPALDEPSLKGLLRRVVGKIFTGRDQGLVQ